MVSWTGSRTWRQRYILPQRMPAVTRKPSATSAASRRTRSRARARIRAHHARHSLLRGRGNARARQGRARVYGERERVRLKLVLRGKRLGLALAEIAELLDLYEIAHNERAQLAKFLDLLAERRGRLMQQKEDIDAVLAEIDGVERECRRRLKNETRSAKSGGQAASSATDDANP
jgi:DNA-binding transcriptional MerR regulator